MLGSERLRRDPYRGQDLSFFCHSALLYASKAYSRATLSQIHREIMTTLVIPVRIDHLFAVYRARDKRDKRSG